MVDSKRVSSNRLREGMQSELNRNLSGHAPEMISRGIGAGPPFPEKLQPAGLFFLGAERADSLHDPEIVRNPGKSGFLLDDSFSLFAVAGDLITERVSGG